MIRVHIICEGQTEEDFIKEVLCPHFSKKGIAVYPSLIGKPGHKGGNFKIERLLDDVRNRIKGDTHECQLFNKWLCCLEHLSS